MQCTFGLARLASQPRLFTVEIAKLPIAAMDMGKAKSKGLAKSVHMCDADRATQPWTTICIYDLTNQTLDGACTVWPGKFEVPDRPYPF